MAAVPMSLLGFRFLLHPPRQRVTRIGLNNISFKLRFDICDFVKIITNDGC